MYCNCSFRESDENVTSVGTFFVFLYNRIFREPYWQIYGNALGTAADSKYSKNVR